MRPGGCPPEPPTDPEVLFGALAIANGSGWLAFESSPLWIHVRINGGYAPTRSELLVDIERDLGRSTCAIVGLKATLRQRAQARWQARRAQRSTDALTAEIATLRQRLRELRGAPSVPRQQVLF